MNVALEIPRWVEPWYDSPKLALPALAQIKLRDPVAAVKSWSFASPVTNALVATIVRTPEATTSLTIVQFCCGSVEGAEYPPILASNELSVPAVCAITTSFPEPILVASKPRANQRVAGPVRVKVTCVPTSILAVIPNPAVELKLTTPVLYVCA